MKKRTRVRVCAMLTALLLAGCGDECAENASRCNGDRAEMCSSGGEWALVADCSEIDGAAFACCADPAGGYNCMLTTECVPSDSGTEGGAP